MSDREKMMAEILARADRQERFSAVISYISSDVSTILDLGCGIGSLTFRLAESFPSALVVGIDRSKYLLENMKRKRNISKVSGEIPKLPFINNTFDTVVTVQVPHEIFHFKGVNVLARTFQNVYNSLKEGGTFILFDHANPGTIPISLQLPEELLETLWEFQSKFKPRQIKYSELSKGIIRISIRDFYDFVTKIWALNTELEDEEMSETHTPFTRQELVKQIQEAGLKVIHLESLTPIDDYLEYYNITLESTMKLPNRHIILHAKK